MNPEQFRLNTPIQNQPITIHIKGSQPWQPRNYDRKYSGSVMLMDALARSLNYSNGKYWDESWLKQSD